MSSVDQATGYLWACLSVRVDALALHPNLMFAGRNIDYMSLTKDFTVDLVKAALTIEAFPSFLRS